MRRTIMRYANLAFVITLTCISPCVKKRFPTMDHLVEAGILLPNEKKIIEQLKTSHSTYWMPLVWASSIAIRARKEGRVRDDFALNTLVEAIANYRSLCGGLYNYDWISIPLVYTQVVTLVVYTFFLATLMGRQYLDPEQGHPGYDVDLYIPIFNFLQFFFYMGWLKVAETLVNPFGEDDDDFEVNWVIDRDIQVSYLIVDEMHQEHPELIKDQYWDEVMPDLPYTAAAMPFYTEPPMGSAANLIIPPHEAEFVPLETLNEDEDGLESIKVNGIPCEVSSDRNRLSHNLSGSSYSGISKLGHSFHPMSYERKGILTMMQDFLSRESSVRKKKLWKVPSKDSTMDPSPSCDTSGPPTPDELKGHSVFNDDIFRLSDLSLADSRGTSIAQSPGIFSNIQVSDFFTRMKPERPHRMNLKTQVSNPKVYTPKSEAAEDDNLKLSNVLRKQRTNSLKHFFRSGKYRGSQKSLLETVSREHANFKKDLQTGTSEDIGSNVDEACDDMDGKDSNTNSDEEVTVREVYEKPKETSKSNIDLVQKSPSASEPISIKRHHHSEASTMSSDDHVLGKLAKEPSTSTLVNADSSLESTPPSNGKLSDESAKNSAQAEQGNEDDVFSDVKADDSGNNISLLHDTPTKPTHTVLPQKKLFSKFRAKRAVSLRIDGYHKDCDSASLSGLQKFYAQNKRHKFLRTVSQPVSPTEINSPTFADKIPTHRSLFSRRLSKEQPTGEKQCKTSQANPEIVVTSQKISEGSIKGRRISDV
ncbi:uncharacterized protein LOC118189269 isoform X2 [Stegodyphus dumicola]|nr:uncharacterized protein LOC118189269 isoform X2 [Stegodyphus dumicola]